MPKSSLSSQDVRRKILRLRDSLVSNLELIQETIDRDEAELRAHLERFGDLKYRPVTGYDADGTKRYGDATEVVLEPLAGKYRATINSLLQSIRLIEAEILPEENPEGSTAQSNSKPEELVQRRASLREQFRAQVSEGLGAASEPITDESHDELVESENIGPNGDSAPKVARKADVEPKTMPKPQRTFIPKVQGEAKPETKPVARIETKELNPKEVGLSPALRERLAGTSRLSDLKKKYGKDE